MYCLTVSAPAAGTHNFDVKVQLSSVDLVTDTNPDTVEIGPVMAVLTDEEQAKLDADLEPNAEVSFSGQAMVIASQNCGDIRFICVIVTITGTATFTEGDATTNNNIMCDDISSIVSCSAGKRYSIKIHHENGPNNVSIISLNFVTPPPPQ